MNLYKSFKPFLTLVMSTACMLSAHAAQATTITMDELDEQSVNGLSLKGAHFSFAIDGSASLDARINASGVGALTYVQDPSLEGSTAGVLSIDFAQAVNTISFGVALSSEFELQDAALIRLVAADATPIADQWVSTLPLILFSEARYEYTGQAVSRIEVSFADHSNRFVIDNLSFATSSVPEPSTALILLVGLAALAAIRPQSTR